MSCASEFEGDFKETVWSSLVRLPLYRIVINFERAYYRIEDKQFRVIFADDFIQGDINRMLCEFSLMIAKEDRERFLSSINERRLRCTSEKNNHELNMGFKSGEDPDKVISIRVKFSKNPLWSTVELCFETYRSIFYTAANGKKAIPETNNE